MKLFKSLILTAFFAGISQFATALSETDVKTFTLQNDMKFLVMEDNSIPNATLYIFWRAGSRNEAPGTTGIAHFFEHMMFNGSKKYGPKMFDKIMEANGGANNAYTAEDITAYMEWFPANKLEVMFELEADRIANLTFAPEIVESERGVVTSERITNLENSNFQHIWEEVKNAAFRAHPYSWPIIGHASDIANWTMEDLKAFYKTYYAPNNALAIVVGAVDANNVKQLAEKHFAHIPKQAPPRPIHTVEPEQTGERRVYVQKPSITSANILMGYHMPANKHDDYPALQLLGDILTRGNSSRLKSALEFEQQVASSVFTYIPNSFDPNLFYVYAVAASGTDAATLENAILKEIHRVKVEGVTDEELQRAKNQREVAFYRNVAEINDRANLLGRYELYYGDYRKMFSAPKAFANVSKEDIKRVANAYLIRKNRTVGILDSKEDRDEIDL